MQRRDATGGCFPRWRALIFEQREPTGKSLDRLRERGGDPTLGYALRQAPFWRYFESESRRDGQAVGFRPAHIDSRRGRRSESLASRLSRSRRLRVGAWLRHRGADSLSQSKRCAGA
jgi:hypothetical protein